ncbi:Phage tail assembly chaperone protein [Marinobacter segnicrescens]|uniref:Phage tail assembly chaperone protein n=1 Tax=Marinobacter segnicrescens TaxID=430453 RepID=A0A1I0H7W2_9GAMM|nr:phage tail assembly chaperone [Marinobacter segnicrescens]SET79691.1 Phage tail assembly chaperone protein [Marinobacter segnicrescens]
MYAIVNKFGVVVGLATKNLGKSGFDYIKVTDEQIIKAIMDKKPVRYIDASLQAVEPFRSKTWEQIRAEREKKFAEADAALFKAEDAEIIDPTLDLSDQKKSIAQYRQALRDIPETFQSPDDVVFPDPPFNN